MNPQSNFIAGAVRERKHLTCLRDQMWQAYSDLCGKELVSFNKYADFWSGKYFTDVLSYSKHTYESNHFH